MKHVLDQRGVVTQIAVLAIVAAVVVVVVIAYINLANHKAAPVSNTNTPTPSSTPSPTKSGSPTPTPTVAPSDTSLITAAVRAYATANANDAVSNVAIDGSNAKGNAAAAGAPSGYEFIAHKANGTWSVVYEGQELPGKSIGEKYGLPTSWYSTSY